MPLCSRSAWKTPSAFTTCPLRVLRRRRRPSTLFDPATQTGTRRVSIMTTIQTQRSDAGLRGLLLSRLNRVHWPAFIPALTRVKKVRELFPTQAERERALEA